MGDVPEPKFNKPDFTDHTGDDYEQGENIVYPKLYYAGIGSRETPIIILKLFTQIGKYLANKNYILRSGHAEGADSAFEYGCVMVNGQKEIYLPWKGFGNSDSNLVVGDPKAYEIAELHHPYWHNLSQGAKKLQARNTHQALGKDLETPAKFIICWTKNGKGSGGTGQCLRIAKAYNIPVFDVGCWKYIDDVKKELKLFLIENGVS